MNTGPTTANQFLMSAKADNRMSKALVFGPGRTVQSVPSAAKRYFVASAPYSRAFQRMVLQHMVLILHNNR